MSDTIRQGPIKGHLFTVDILIESPSNVIALEKLVHLLNSPDIKDYKIARGIELGKLIDAAVQAQAHSSQNLAAQIEHYKTNNTLVRLTVVKGKGIKLSIPCRILNYDSTAHLVSVYHVDEKKVYLFTLNEIDDLQAG